MLLLHSGNINFSEKKYIVKIMSNLVIVKTILSTFTLEEKHGFVMYCNMQLRTILVFYLFKRRNALAIW